MYKIRNVWAYDNAVKKNEDKLQNVKKEMKVQCKCGLRYSFYAFETKDRKICKQCGTWVYKDLETQKKYEERDKKCIEERKQREFEQMIKKYMKESNENANRIEGRNLGIQSNTKNRKKTR